MILVELHSVVIRIMMAKDLFHLTSMAWLMTCMSVFADIYTNDYDVIYGCDFTYGVVIETAYNIRSITECCWRCDRTSQCISVKYDDVNSECHFNSYRRPIVNDTCPDKFGYAELLKSSKGKLINDDCTISTNCSVPNSQCSMNKCQCEPGYSYRHANESCLASCDSYGATFTRYPAHNIGGHNNKILIDRFTDDACIQACVEETNFECLTIEYNPDIPYCILSMVTALMYPDLYTPIFDLDYYQRNCQ